MPDNYYIAKFQPLIDSCKTPEEYSAVYLRISSCIAGMILGRGFNQSFEDYLSDKPIKKEFHEWWLSIKDSLHAKSTFKSIKANL